jgi:hypothetical protein
VQSSQSKVSAEPLIEQQRADALAALVEPGRRRREAITITQAAEDELRPLVATAVQVNATYRRIRELTGLSLDTIGTWAHAEQSR